MAQGSEIAKQEQPEIDPKILERVVLYNDVSGLSPVQKVAYASALAVRVGLDPATAPFKVIKKKGGGEGLYADKGTTDQLRKKHKISVKIVSREVVESSFVVTAQAREPDGREDESTGAVPIAGLKGEEHSNALMKAETKAKRRVTLSLLGLGAIADESELNDGWANDRFASIPQEQTPATAAPKSQVVVQMPPPKAKPAAAPEQPRQEARKGEALPEVWTIDEPLPAALLLWLRPLQSLAGKPVSGMVVEELELVVEQVKRGYERATANPKSTARLLKLLQEIAACASYALDKVLGIAPPKDDTPPIIDDEQMPVGA